MLGKVKQLADKGMIAPPGMLFVEYGENVAIAGVSDEGRGSRIWGGGGGMGAPQAFFVCVCERVRRGIVRDRGCCPSPDRCLCRPLGFLYVRFSDVPKFLELDADWFPMAPPVLGGAEVVCKRNGATGKCSLIPVRVRKSLTDRLRCLPSLQDDSGSQA